MNAVTAANFLGIHVETLRKMARRNEIPCFKLGKSWRFRRGALLRWADEQRGRGGDRPLLIVDDDEPVRRSLVKMIHWLGYRAVESSTSEEGLELVAAESPALILLDLVMPKLNGPQFLEELRKTDEELPVIIVTGYPESRLMSQAMRFPPVMLLAKPVEPSLLERTIRCQLGERTRGREREVR